MQLPTCSDSALRKRHQASEILCTYKTSEYIMQVLYSESQTPNKCKRVLKKRGCCGLQLCLLRKTVYPAKCSFLTVCPCQSIVYTCLVALLNGEDSAVRLTVLYFSLTEGGMVHLRETEATWEELKAKRATSLYLSKQIFLPSQMHHYMRAPCSQPETKWNGYFCLLHEL